MFLVALTFLNLLGNLVFLGFLEKNIIVRSLKDEMPLNT